MTTDLFSASVATRVAKKTERGRKCPLLDEI